MAQIVFIINDEDGSVNVTAAAEPFISADPEAELTPAQHVAQLVATVLTTALAPAGETEEPEQAQLVVVGDTGDGNPSGS